MYLNIVLEMINATHLLLVFLMSIFDIRRYNVSYLIWSYDPLFNEIDCFH